VTVDSGLRARRAGGAAAAVIAAVVLGAALLSPGLGRAPFDDPGEGQHAEIAREIHLPAGWLSLRLNGVRYYDKPPLLYWLVAASFALFGQGEAAARLVPLAGALCAAAATAWLGARLLGAAWGLAAAGALYSSVLFAVFSRYVRPETLFVGFIQWGFTGLLLGALAPAGSRARQRWLIAGCACLGLASIAKDPLGLIGPLVAVAAALWLGGRLDAQTARLPAAGIAVLLAVGFSWYLAAAIANRGFAWYALVDNHILNLVERRWFPDEDVPLSTVEFLAVAALGAFPWTIAAALEVAALARRRAWRQPAELPWVALAVWMVALVAFFAAAPFKLPHYGLPVYPAVALLAVRHWASTKRPRGLIAIHLAVLMGLTAGAIAVAASDGRAFTDQMFSATDVYTRKESTVGQTSPLPAWSSLRPLLEHAVLIFAAGSAALAAALWRRAAGLGLAAVVATMLALMPEVTAGAALVASGRAVATLAADLRRAMRPGDLLVHEGPIENSGAIEFYAGRRPVLLEAKKSVLGMGATFPDAADTFWDPPALARAWASERRVFLVTTRVPDKSVVGRLPAERVHLLESRNGRWLYSNVPAQRVGASPR